MNNREMFIYVYGVLMHQGTVHACEKTSELSKQDKNIGRWFNSEYTCNKADLPKDIERYFQNTPLEEDYFDDNYK